MGRCGGIGGGCRRRLLPGRRGGHDHRAWAGSLAKPGEWPCGPLAGGVGIAAVGLAHGIADGRCRPAVVRCEIGVQGAQLCPSACAMGPIQSRRTASVTCIWPTTVCRACRNISGRSGLLSGLTLGRPCAAQARPLNSASVASTASASTSRARARSTLSWIWCSSISSSSSKCTVNRGACACAGPACPGPWSGAMRRVALGHGEAQARELLACFEQAVAFAGCARTVFQRLQRQSGCFPAPVPAVGGSGPGCAVRCAQTPGRRFLSRSERGLASGFLSLRVAGGGTRAAKRPQVRALFPDRGVHGHPKNHKGMRW